MNKPDPVLLIKELIRVKEAEHAAQEIIVREQLLITYENLKPINILKNTISQAASSRDLMNSLGKAAINWTAGMIISKLNRSVSSEQTEKIFTDLVEIFAASKITENADDVKAIAAIALKKFLNHLNDQKEER